MGGNDVQVEGRRVGTVAFEASFAVAAATVAIGGLWYSVRTQEPQIMLLVAAVTFLLAAIAVLPGVARSLRRRA